MKIRYTRHAKRRMKWRRISAEEVEFVLAEPDEVRPYPLDPKARNALKRVGKRRLLVGYKRIRNEFLILTAIDKAR